MENDRQRGEDILKLLRGFVSKPVIGAIQRLYDNAYEVRLEASENAIKSCEKALDILEDLSKETLPNKEEVVDSKGRVSLLIASIYLNEETELEKAAEYYRLSEEAYHEMQWSHLESLTCLGLAITLRKWGKLKEASEECEKADTQSKAESIERKEIDIKDLQAAIDEERKRIHKLLEEEISPETEKTPSPDRRKLPDRLKLPVFDIQTGKKIVEKKTSMTKFNVLSLSDYKQMGEGKDKTFDLTNFPDAKKAAYVLEVKKVDKTEGKVNEGDKDELQRDHLIFIAENANLTKLKGKTVAVLIMTRTITTGIHTCATLKICVAEEKDHCLLKGVYSGDISIVVASYNTDTKLDRYYQGFMPFTKKFAYDIAISGEVIAVIRADALS